MDERIYQIALSCLLEIGPIAAKQLVAHVGSLEGVFAEQNKTLQKIEGIGQQRLALMNREGALRKAEKELKFIEQHNIQLYYYQDANYPTRLRTISDGPIVLFTKGKVALNKRNLSIVGTRKSTPYGKKLVDNLVGNLASMDVRIISGLAHGIDKYAHEAALENGLSTYAVLGHGLDTMYPAVHRTLAKRMLEKGGLISEFVSGIPGDPSNFPRRNRIVAGLCDALVVVESSEKGGSLITANLANDYNRDVFAFPGDVTKDSSKGCNNLIRRDKAHLITCAEDMLSILNWEIEEKDEIQETIFIQMTEEEERLVDVFKNEGSVELDVLNYRTAIPTSELAAHLFNLELKGVVKALPGNRYALV